MILKRFANLWILFWFTKINLLYFWMANSNSKENATFLWYNN